MAARFACPSGSAARRPPAREPTTIRSGSPSATISSNIAMFTGASPGSVRGGKRLGALDLEDRLAHGDRTLARLGAQQLEPQLLVAVALPQLGALIEPGLDAPGHDLGVDGQKGVPATPQVDRLGRSLHDHDLAGVGCAAQPRPGLQLDPHCRPSFCSLGTTSSATKRGSSLGPSELRYEPGPVA